MDDETEKTMAISGASGLVGSALAEAATERGWSVVPMVRDRRQEGIYWSADEETVDAEALEGVDAVVHLAGENLASGRWTESKKEKLLESRTRGTTLIAEAVASLSDPPEVFVCASAVGFYGLCGKEWVDEQNDSGRGFLADVCQSWEAACEPAESVSRVVNTRLGVVLSKEGGALNKMLLPFKLGVGGRLGDGEQFMSWVAVDDVVRALLFVVEDSDLEGPVNVTSPKPVQNAEFTDALGEVLGRPTILPVPGPVLKLAMGSEMAEETLLNGQRVRPKRLVEAGFEFRYPEVREALTAELG